MARSFTEAEKENIRGKLIDECEKSWATFGYKRTSIEDLCSRVGISKGAFYAFFPSKEHLFCDVLDRLQEQHKALADSLPPNPTKEDICQLLKQLYLAYDKTNILVQRNSPDFICFLNRAPREWVASSQKVSEDFIAKYLSHSNLHLKISREKALGIFEALLSILMSKDILHYDHYEVFCTLLDRVIGEIYE